MTVPTRRFGPNAARFDQLTVPFRHGFPLHRVAPSPQHFEYGVLAIAPKPDIESATP